MTERIIIVYWFANILSNVFQQIDLQNYHVFVSQIKIIVDILKIYSCCFFIIFNSFECCVCGKCKFKQCCYRVKVQNI